MILLELMYELFLVVFDFFASWLTGLVTGLV